VNKDERDMKKSWLVWLGRQVGRWMGGQADRHAGRQ